MAARIVVNRETVNDVCRNLQKYITWCDSDASMVSTAYVMALDETVVRQIMVALLRESGLNVPAGHVVEDLLAFRQIMAVWLAVCELRQDVLEWLDEEVLRRRGARTEVHGAYGPAAPLLNLLSRGPDGAALSRAADGPERLDRTDGRILGQMRSHLARV